MNEHTRKLLDDAKNEKFTDVLEDLEYDDININASDDKGKTVLHYASENNWDSIIIKILQNVNVNVNAQDDYGKTPLHYAACHWKHESLKILLAHKVLR